MAAGPSQPITLSGFTVGALDPTQPARLLSSPHSKLSFSTFHPLAASPATRKLSSRDELNSKKRIVIEILPTGESYWRWVPRAKGVDAAGGDEGEWPRVVDICGQQMLCSQDQWDIYKLDPQYECTVYPAPQLSTITRRKEKEIPSEDSPARPRKRPIVEDDSDDELPMPGKLKKSRAVAPEPEPDDATDSDDEVEMIVDTSTDSLKARETRRKKMEENRKARREKVAQKTAHPSKVPEIEDSDLSMIDLTLADTQPPSYSSQASTGSNPPLYTSNPPSFSSQPPSFTSQPSSDSSQPLFNAPQPPQSSNLPSHAPSAPHGNGAPPPPFQFKRANESPPNDRAPKRMRRMRSPSTVREEPSKKVKDKRRFRQGRFNERLTKMQDERNKIFEKPVRTDVLPDMFMFNGPTPSTENTAEPSRQPTEQPEAEPSPVEETISLEEKIRRVQEINAWEQARLERELAQRKAAEAEAERKRKHEEAQQRERERAQREKLEREREQERRKKQQQEEEARWRRKLQEEEARRRKQAEERYAFGPWTPQRALERYKSLADAFDAAQFTAESPITFATVPWPVLHKPTRFSVEDVDWASVEAFFTAVRPHMRPQDYKVFVEKSHRRFHPDRWRARRVLQSVEDDELRACLEVAANTVAQAITPLWREVKSN